MKKKKKSTNKISCKNLVALITSKSINITGHIPSFPDKFLKKKYVRIQSHPIKSTAGPFILCFQEFYNVLVTIAFTFSLHEDILCINYAGSVRAHSSPLMLFRRKC